MVTTIIIFLLIAVAIGIRNDYKKQKAAQAQSPIKSPALEIKRKIEKRHKRLETRGARLDRHRRIWSVLFLVNSFYTAEEVLKRGAYTKRAMQDLERAKSFVLEYKPTESDIKTAIRFCQMEHTRGKCPHKLTDSDIDTIMNIYDVVQLPPPMPLN